VVNKSKGGATVKVRHNLPVLMAQRKIKSLMELSRKSGIEYPTLYNFNTYVHKKIDPEIVVHLCETLDCSIGQLFYLEDDKEGTHG
jgi:DNA-binding Xre family transcriptional regulator